MKLFCFVKLETIMINELDKSTKKIDFSYSNLKSLKGGNLNNFNKLEELNIEFNNVNLIMFFSCINLKILKLGNNQLTHINKSIFSKLINLEYLDLIKLDQI
jgi:Leucine-rich repeat (LRR) protein